MAKIPKPNEEEVVRKVVNTKTGDFSVKYANSVEVQITPWDFRLTFGIVQAASKDSIAIEYHTQVYMSPQHAKAAFELLKQKLEQYEQDLAPIPEFPHLKANVKADSAVN